MKQLGVFIFLLFFWVNTPATDVVIWKEDSEIIVLDRVTVQKIFTKKLQRWPDGRNINVFVKPLGSIEHRDFVNNVLKITPFYFQQQLEEQTYAGKSSSITEVPDDKTMIAKIEQTPGSIGYVNYILYTGSKRVIIIDIVGEL